MTDTDFEYPSDAQGLSGALGAWGAAWQSGRCSPDDVLDVLSRWSPRHRVIPADRAAAQELSLEANGEESDALLRLIREGSPRGLATLLVAPGDMLGLPPRSPVTTAALDAGELLVVPGHHALVPRRLDRYTVGWSAHTMEAPTAPITLPLGEVEYELRESIRSAAEILADLRLPRSTPLPDPRAKVAELTGLAATQLPPNVNTRAERILEQAAHVAAILAVAAAAAPDFGINAAGQHTGDGALRELGRTVRVARMSATNAVISELLHGNKV
ncbi:MAG: hypothetical protein C0482_00395 [Gordonia sp.]|jgi:hypothetical protein|uniref:Uncharacterized protein n=1 Tax=Gordonia rubripertincta TaxID=36822 RepID=A0ABT4MUF2_GORRU|nr:MULTISPECIES: hypothetical protein [Mycobacteriales]MBA4020801.1 hypothetical protein [Gordonia sp. (in: high G+C Gram-positive bacteria)]MCZ4550633.1 hypothetical protein [Gordonia rubripertincta]OZG28519.1 hypothetical protein BH683_014140 [Williamsia sp. 1138]